MPTNQRLADQPTGFLAQPIAVRRRELHLHLVTAPPNDHSRLATVAFELALPDDAQRIFDIADGPCPNANLRRFAYTL